MRNELTHFLKQRDVTKLDVEQFIAQTAWVQMPVVDRLQALAHRVEQAMSAHPPDEQFLALRRIYTRALAEAPHDPWLWHAWGSKAAARALQSARLGTSRWMWTEVEEALERAMRLAPGHPDLAFAYAKVLYDNPSRSATDALPWFRQVLGFAPDHQSARLFVGHCLQQLGRWQEAADTYEALLAESSDGPAPLPVHANWAHCLQQLGQSQRAQAAFSQIFDVLETLPPERCVEALESLDSMDAFPPQLVERWQGMLTTYWRSSML